MNVQQYASVCNNVQSFTLSKKEICAVLGIHRNTLTKWLKLAKIETGKRRILTPIETKKFLNHIGELTPIYQENNLILAK